MGTIFLVKRKTFLQLLRSLQPKLFGFAYQLIPDELQAQQLVIDAVTLMLLQEKDRWMELTEEDVADRKYSITLKKQLLKSLLGKIFETGIKRHAQLGYQAWGEGQQGFYALEARTRGVVTLRFKLGFSVDEVIEMTKLERHIVIEQIHNGRFLLTGTFRQPDFSKREAQL